MGQNDSALIIELVKSCDLCGRIKVVTFSVDQSERHPISLDQLQQAIVAGRKRFSPHSHKSTMTEKIYTVNSREAAE